MIGDFYISKKPKENGKFTVIEQTSPRQQYEKGCSRFYYFRVRSHDDIRAGFTSFQLTEKQKNLYYEKIPKGIDWEKFLQSKNDKSVWVIEVFHILKKELKENIAYSNFIGNMITLYKGDLLEKLEEIKEKLIK